MKKALIAYSTFNLGWKGGVSFVTIRLEVPDNQHQAIIAITNAAEKAALRAARDTLKGIAAARRIKG